MKKVYILVAAVMAAGILVTSCSKKEEATPAPVAKTPTENKQTMSSTTTAVQADVKELVATPGVKAISSFSSFSSKDDPFTATKSGGPSILMQVLTPETLINLVQTSKLKATDPTSTDRFDFVGSAGTYEWNASTKAWKITQKDPSDKIVVKFPSDSTKTTNDAVLTISKYADVAVGNNSANVGNKYSVSEIEANITVSGTEALTFSASVAYLPSGLPSKLKLSLGVNPFSFTIDYADAGASQSLATALKKSGTTMFGVAATINYLTATKDSVISITGVNLTYKDVQLKGDAKVADMMKAMSALPKEPTQADVVAVINKNCVFAMYRTDDGTKMGDIVAVVKGETMDFNIKYSETESESLSDYATKIGDAIEQDLANLSAIFAKAI